MARREGPARFTAAIVGRPNVGKSTLFNRLVGRRLALVDDTPGVTRDRRRGEASIGALNFDVIDTAGLEDSAPDSLSARMREQTEKAIGEADLVLFMIDARAGILPDDEAFARLVRASDRPVVLVANKAEGRSGEAGAYDAFSLGLGEPVAISAEHGEGMGTLQDALLEALELAPAAPEDEPDEAAGEEGEGDDGPARPVRIAVVGRPNAGKSTLVNRMLGEERMLTGPEAGITRDTITVDWLWRGRPVKLFDTAGMRRKARVTEKLEKLSVADTLRAVRFAEVVVILLDAEAPFERQDLSIADLVIREGRAPVVALNKWDRVTDRQARLKELREEAAHLLPQVGGLKVVPLSGMTGEGLDRLMQTVFEVHAAWNRRVPTAKLNRWLEAAVESHPPPAVSGRRIRIKYATQVKSRPPTFMAACTRPEALPESYSRYLLNSLREAFDLHAVPLRLHFRRGDNPYARGR